MSDADWLEYLVCPRCGGRLARRPRSEMHCTACPAIVSQEDGVYDFLTDPHPTVARELRAIASEDSSDPGFMAEFRRWLHVLDVGPSGAEAPQPADELSEFVRNALHHRRQLIELLRKYPLRGNRLLVELGADHCWASGIYLDRGLNVIAVDISDHLKLAPRADAGAMLRIKADMNRLPLRDGCADYVLANACVHHSWDIDRTFAEAHRILTPDGRLYLCSEPMPSIPRYLLFRLSGSFGARERALGINETLHRRSAWLAAAKRAGFRPVTVLPHLTDGEVSAKLKTRRLPAFLTRPAKWFLRFLQVSIHMVAEKKGSAGDRGAGPRSPLAS